MSPLKRKCFYMAMLIPLHLAVSDDINIEPHVTLTLLSWMTLVGGGLDISHTHFL